MFCVISFCRPSLIAAAGPLALIIGGVLILAGLGARFRKVQIE